jgi:hypothetical protein
MIDTEFWYPSFPGGQRKDAVWRLQIFGNVVIATEIPKNQGKSITNAIPDLAEAVAANFNLDRQQLVWVEHYTPDSYRGRDRTEDFDLVSLGSTNPKIVGPVAWQHSSKEAVEQLVGQPIAP